jgi:outer membrane immunogenic protein
MRYTLTATLAALGLSIGISGAAFAADLAQRPAYKAPPPPAPPPFSWTGFYLGGNAGGVWTDRSVTDTLTGASLIGSNSGFIGGGQLGYNWQISNWVWGIEGEFDGTTLNRTGSGVTVVPGGDTIQASARTDWVSMLTGRVGWAVFDRSLIYVKGGGAWVESHATLTDLTTGASISGSHVNDGWVVGAGWEWAFAPQWSVKFEYNHIGLENFTPSNTLLVDGGALADQLVFRRDLDIAKVGINYRFNWGGAY